MINKYRIIIYGRKTCVYCAYAVDFCQAKGFDYIFLDYYDNLNILEECKEFYDQSTVPIILTNDLDTGKVTKVGGYQDFLELFGE